MKVIVFGATGGLGQRVWRQAVDQGHQVVAYVRTPAKLDHSDPRFEALEVVAGDALDAEAVAAASRACDAAVNCTSPAGGSSTLEMARSVATNASASGVRRFYMVGGLGALWVPGTNRTVLVQDWADPEAMRRHGLTARIPRELLRKMTKGHLAAMEAMDSLGLPHAFVCPGRMTEGEPSPSPVVTLDEVGGSSVAEIPYADVANVIVADLDLGALLGHRVCISRNQLDNG